MTGSPCTAPNDYTTLNEVVTLQLAANSQTVCRAVTINDDLVLESMEIFLLTLVTSDPRVVLTVENSRAPVIITDNDGGMCHYTVYRPETLTIHLYCRYCYCWF